ncbi:MAG: radical SAM protein [Candidatus Omnitrophica bacterium]|nr:radical SAM protein [Candidatus Omnitrophota bacterium]
MAIKKESILLINPGHEGKSSVAHSVPHRIHRDIPPISILTLASYLERAGENAVILDTHLDPDYEANIDAIISKENIVLVGITTFIGKFTSNARDITKYIKSRYPGLPVVWGGPLTSTLPDSCLIDGGADYIILFNGEEPLRLLVSAIKEKRTVNNIPNLGYLEEGKVVYTNKDINLPIFNDSLKWEMLGNRMNSEQIPYLAYIFSSKGCPYSCRFCYNQNRYEKSNKYYFRDPDSILNELDSLNNKYGINVFTFGDDNFFFNKKRAIEITTRMKDKGFYIEQAIGTFSDFNDEVIVGLRGICQTIICSIESASDKLLKLIRKPIRLSDIPKVNTKLNEAGINTIHNFIFGLPGEDDHDRRAAVELMLRLKSINPYVRGMAYFFTPFPGTPIIKDIEKEYGNFSRNISFWKDCEIIGLRESYKFRPWLKEDEQLFLGDFMSLFKDLFQSINQPLTQEQCSRINNSSRLKYIFSGMDRVNFPKDREPKYLLDKVLKARAASVH